MIDDPVDNQKTGGHFPLRRLRRVKGFAGVIHGDQDVGLDVVGALLNDFLRLDDFRQGMGGDGLTGLELEKRMI